MSPTAAEWNTAQGQAQAAAGQSCTTWLCEKLWSTRSAKLSGGHNENIADGNAKPLDRHPRAFQLAQLTRRLWAQPPQPEIQLKVKHKLPPDKAAPLDFIVRENVREEKCEAIWPAQWKYCRWQCEASWTTPERRKWSRQGNLVANEVDLKMMILILLVYLKTDMELWICMNDWLIVCGFSHELLNLCEWVLWTVNDSRMMRMFSLRS